MAKQKESRSEQNSYKTKTNTGQAAGVDADLPGQEGGRPESPMPAQHQPKPGIEADITPRPQYFAPEYKGANKLEGKAAIITGGDSGIGRGVAVLYAREGADVAIVYLPEEQVDADETKRVVELEGHRCLLIPGDV